MDIRISGFKTHSSSIYLNVMNYIIALTNQHSGCGDFNFFNFNDKKLAYKYGLTKVNQLGEIVMSDDWYDCRKVLEHLGIITKTDSYCECYNRSEKYCINKELLIIFYSALLSLENYSNKQIKLLHKKELGNNIKEIINGILESRKDSCLYKNKDFSRLIKDTYFWLKTICNYVLENHLPQVEHFNEYTYFYGAYLVKNKQMSSLSGGPINLNKSYTQIVPFSNEKDVCWFTNQYLEKKRHDSKKLEKNYEEYLIKNKHLKPIIEKLEKEYNRLGMYDIDIDKELFNTLPGNTEEKKKDILCNLVKYWVIKNCPFLNYTMGLVDNLSDLEENYRMDTHISIINRANQYGVYGYRIHFSGRMSSDSCKLKKAKHCERFEDSRECAFEQMGFDYNDYEDLKGSVFLLSYCLNHHIDLDFDYDIKEKMASLGIVGRINGVTKEFERNDYKGVGFYTFFPNGVDIAREYYKNRYNAKFHKILKKYDEIAYEEAMNKTKEEYKIEKDKMDAFIACMSPYDFTVLYNYVQKSTGGTTKYSCNIFVIESAIMALLADTLRKQGKEMKIVYDCVWTKRNQISRDDVRKIWIECARVVFKKYYECEGNHNYLCCTGFNTFNELSESY